MGLKITLKAGERMIIGGAVIINGPSRCQFVVENKIPILRQKDILNSEEANTPAKRIYFAIQLMYIDSNNLTNYHKMYWKLVREFLDAAPSSLSIIDKISENILQGNHYQSLRSCKKLIFFEEEVIARVQ